MHFSGLAGMPRRIPDYPDAFAGWNYVSALVHISRFLLPSSLYLYSLKHLLEPVVHQKPLGEGATTFEWKLSSPPIFHSYDDIPKVK